MKKLITILGAGLLAFGMFTSCGAKDVNLSWSDEKTTYEYTYAVTAGTVSRISEPNSYSAQQALTTATTTTSYAYTVKKAEVKWVEGYAGNNATVTKGNVDSYEIKFYYDLETTTTEKATGNVTDKSYSRNQDTTVTIEKVGDKYYVNYGTAAQSEVTVDGDLDDDEFTFSADVFSVTFVDDWKADGTTNFYQGNTKAVQRAVRSGTSYSNVTLERL